MKRTYLIIYTILAMVLIVSTPISASGKANSHNRIPALNIKSNTAVLVPERAIENSPVLEPAIVVIEVGKGAFFILLEEDADISPGQLRDALMNALQEKVEIVSTEPFLWVIVGEDATREQVYVVLQEIEEMLDWMTGRSVGWGTYW